MTAAEANAVYDCLLDEMVAGYKKSGLTVSWHYKDWDGYSTQPYASATHGSRFVRNYANAVAKPYGEFENAGRMPVGSILAKDSFHVLPDGKTAAGPLFLMEKMPVGFREESGNWRYTMIMADGAVAGVTNGKGAENVEFCIGCHATVGDSQDHMMLLPESFRATRR